MLEFPELQVPVNMLWCPTSIGCKEKDKYTDKVAGKFRAS